MKKAKLFVRLSVSWGGVALIEEWKTIPNFPMYEASSLGRIRSIDRIITRNDGKVLHLKQHILKPTKSNGYYSVNVSENNKISSVKVHILVAQAFLGVKSKNLDVRHKNGDKTDNRIDNLEYGTRSDNMLDGYKIRGRTMYCQKLSPIQAKEIRQKYQQGKSQRQLAKEYDVSKTTIASILHNKIYTKSLVYCTSND